MSFQLAPGFSIRGRAQACSFCGRGPGKSQPNNPISQDRPIITTDLAIDMEGIFEFCVDCGSEIGALVGMISKETNDKNREAAKEAAELLALSEDARKVAEDALSALANAGWHKDEDDS